MTKRKSPAATIEQSKAILAGRLRLGLTMRELAHKVGLDQGTLQRIVNGDAPLTQRSRELIEEVLGRLP